MRVLLLRPVSPNERFGLGPFFKVEPLGLEYLGAALRRAGHEVALADLRFSPSLPSLMRRHRPEVVAISCTHTVDVPATQDLARWLKARAPGLRVVVGGHAASVFPEPLFRPSIDAVCAGDGEQTLPALLARWQRGETPRSQEGFHLALDRHGHFSTPLPWERPNLDDLAVPARDLAEPFRRHYRCVHKTPLWALETSRGCPYRCSFCSIWRHADRTFRQRSIEAVADDFEATGPNLFIIDDLFWHPRERSRALAEELRRRGVRKEWMLVQARLDTVARSPELLELWRPLAKDFDIFFGFEAPSDAQLKQLQKDATVATTIQGVAVARDHRYGVTGNFVIDPDWNEEDFHRMWSLVDQLDLRRSGYTVLTPLPGTPLYDELEPRLAQRDWSKFDMHHLLFEPKLGRHRFFELFVESWRRNVLSANRSTQHWARWFRQLGPRQTWELAKVLLHTQRMLNPQAYLAETFPMQWPTGVTDDAPST